MKSFLARLRSSKKAVNGLEKVEDPAPTEVHNGDPTPSQKESFSCWLQRVKAEKNIQEVGDLSSTSVGIPDEIRQAALKELESLQSKYGYIQPERGNLDDSTIVWRHGKPDYTTANLTYLLGKTRNHAPGSLEHVVENLVKTWEMEASHKADLSQWTTIKADEYHVQANGKTRYGPEEAKKVGNYNVLLDGCPAHLYDNTKEDFESSHGAFRQAFPNGFPWELLEVYSGPPRVTFSWRHWAEFEGSYKENHGKGEVVELFGFAVVDVNTDLKITNLEVYYNPVEFLQVLEGLVSVEDVKTPFKIHCPFRN
eukprot:TRINITY_DN2059_c0_g1_i1.p1 TRINITY_DN2059_c0_g1~~TRINITY_DN2059_c0_g1_i1.p1  ORF type:complete len:310 (+),score=33.43 TRINITY_DN2059_c0_g1_i1:106-1035(+)